MSSPCVVLELVQPLSYYLKLFTSQYQNSANLLAWQTALMTPLNDLANCLEGMNCAFDLDTAVGTQLDALGKLVGVSRTLPFQPSAGVSPVLDDATYRLLIRATMLENTWNGTMESLYAGWKQLFPNGTLIIQDNQNMTANILVSGTFTSIEIDLIEHGMIVPRPEGVLYNYIPPGAGPYFGFDLNTSTIAGFDTGKWA